MMLNKTRLNRRKAIKLGLGFLVGTGIVFAKDSKNRVLSQDWQSLPERKNFLIAQNSVTVNTNSITGANIDTTSIKRTINVNINHANASDSNAGYRRTPLKTIKAAIEMAKEFIVRGEGVRIRIHEGVYREGEFTIDGRKLGNLAKNATLIIEGKGKVIISGSEIWQPDTWEKVQQRGVTYYQHNWLDDFGNDDGFWGRHNPQEVIAHRSEMVFINGKPLKQVLLENYDYNLSSAYSGSGTHRYRGFSKPQDRLKPDTFGVAERTENGNKIYLRPDAGIDFKQAKIEVVTKRFLLRFFHLNNVWLHNLTFQHSANVLKVPGAAVLFGPWSGGKEFRNQNILISNCNFLWNNTRGLSIFNSRNITIKNNTFNYNGFAGVVVNSLMNTIWDRNETNFNNWRGYQSGFTDWAIAAIKVHNTRKSLFRNHQAIGNKTGGLWFDNGSRNIAIERLTAIENIQGLHIEISPGNFSVKKSLLAYNQGGNLFIDNATNFAISNSLIYGDDRGDAVLFNSSPSRKYNDPIGEILGESNTKNVPIYLGNSSFRNNVIVNSDPSKALLVQNRGNHSLYKEFLQQEYTGSRNIYFSPTEQVFGIGFQRHRMTDLDDWSNFTGEINSQWQNPNFFNPANYDLRMGNATAKGRLGGGFPQRNLNSATKNAMFDFFAWVDAYLAVVAPLSNHSVDDRSDRLQLFAD